MAVCDICGATFGADVDHSPFLEAGEWLAAEVWHDAGRLCPLCLENRARLALMYMIDR